MFHVGNIRIYLEKGGLGVATYFIMAMLSSLCLSSWMEGYTNLFQVPYANVYLHSMFIPLAEFSLVRLKHNTLLVLGQP